MVKIPHNWLLHPVFFTITDPTLGLVVVMKNENRQRLKGIIYQLMYCQWYPHKIGGLGLGHRGNRCRFSFFIFISPDLRFLPILNFIIGYIYFNSSFYLTFNKCNDRVIYQVMSLNVMGTNLADLDFK